MTLNVPQDGLYKITGLLHFNKEQEVREGRIVVDGQIVHRQLHSFNQTQITMETFQRLKIDTTVEIFALSNSGIVEPLPPFSAQKIQ